MPVAVRTVSPTALVFSSGQKKTGPKAGPVSRGWRRLARPRRHCRIQCLLGGRWRWLSRQRSTQRKSGSGRSVRLARGGSRFANTPHRWQRRFMCHSISRGRAGPQTAHRSTQADNGSYVTAAARLRTRWRNGLLRLGTAVRD